MSQSTEKPSARSGRLLLGAAGIAMLSTIGAVETSNMDLRTANHGLKTQVSGLQTDLAKEQGEVANLSATLVDRNKEIRKQGDQIAKLTTDLKDTKNLLATTEKSLEAGQIREKGLNEKLIAAKNLETSLRGDIAAAK